MICKMRLSSLDWISYFRSLNHFNEVYENNLNFLDEGWLSANIDWELLNLSVLEGARGIHCGYYFETFERNIGRDYVGILNYDPVQAKYDQSISLFNVGCKANDEFDVWMSLGGTVMVEYLLNDEHYNFVTVQFRTEVNVRIRDKIITSYEANYDEENSGLFIEHVCEIL